MDAACELLTHVSALLMQAWPSQVMGFTSGMTARHDYFGVYATAASRQPKDVVGDTLQVSC